VRAIARNAIGERKKSDFIVALTACMN